MSTRIVALLRGVNVGGHRPVPMADLRALAESLGYTRVSTYIQSGNLVCDAPDGGAALPVAIERRFGFAVDVAVRNAEAWRAIAAGCPFPEAAAARPKFLHVAMGVDACEAAVADALRSRGGREPVAVADGALWIDYLDGVGKSKLTPAVLDRAAGTPLTARNWSTVQALLAMV